jgi:hypothetical protein
VVRGPPKPPLREGEKFPFQHSGSFLQKSKNQVQGATVPLRFMARRPSGSLESPIIMTQAPGKSQIAKRTIHDVSAQAQHVITDLTRVLHIQLQQTLITIEI